MDQNGNLLAEKTRIIENFREEEYTNKVYVIRRNDLELRKFMAGENILQLVVRSQYAGWENYVCEAEMVFNG